MKLGIAMVFSGVLALFGWEQYASWLANTLIAGPVEQLLTAAAGDFANAAGAAYALVGAYFLICVGVGLIIGQLMTASPGRGAMPPTGASRYLAKAPDGAVTRDAVAP